MKFIICFLVFIAGCSHRIIKNPYEDWSLLQRIWNSQDTEMAYRNLPGLKIVENEDGIIVLSNGKNHLFSFAIYVNAKINKIISIRAPVSQKEGIFSTVVKSILQSDDWKTFEHPLRGVDYLQLDVTEYSEKLGVGFSFDRLDADKKTKMIYWGLDPKNIKQLL